MRRLSAAALALLLAGCAGGAKERAPTARASHGDFGLPPVRAALQFPPATSTVTLAWLVDELARLSGQELALAPDLRQQLEQWREPLEHTAPVPADEVYGFVEALLWRQGLVVAPVTAGTRPVLGIHGSPERGGGPRPVPIEPAQVADLARHPALLCQVVIPFQNLDSRQLQTQLRQLLADTGQHQQIVPVGERSLLIQAGGAKLHGLVEMLQAVDRASAARPRSPEGAAAAPDAKWPTTPRSE